MEKVAVKKGLAKRYPELLLPQFFYRSSRMDRGLNRTITQSVSIRILQPEFPGHPPEVDTSSVIDVQITH